MKIIRILQFTGERTKGGVSDGYKIMNTILRRTLEKLKPEVHLESGNSLSLGEQKSHEIYYSQEAELAERINGSIQQIPQSIRTRSANIFFN